MQSQPTGFPGQGPQQPQQGQQRPGGNLSFLNAPPPSSQFNPSGMAPQMTGYPGAASGGMMSQQTGYGGIMSQPTGMMGQQTGMPGMMGQRTGMMSQQTGMMPQQTGYGGGMMSQPTGFGGGLRAQPTGYQDPRLQSMMQSFMPSNMSQVSRVAIHLSPCTSPVGHGIARALVTTDTARVSEENAIVNTSPLPALT